VKEFQEMIKYVYLSMQNACGVKTKNGFREQGNLEGDVFEVLSSMGDFEEFKEMMLDYKEVSDFNFM
jgi:hypothetical protein